MTTARDVVEAWFKAIGNGDLKGAVRLVGPNTELIAPGVPTMRGTEQIGGFLQAYLTAFPGAGFTLDNVWDWGQTVVVEGTYGGTHTGPLTAPDGTEIPPTGKTATIPFLAVIDCEGGVITSHRAYWDNLGFMAQLGIAPQ